MKPHTRSTDLLILLLLVSLFGRLSPLTPPPPLAQAQVESPTATPLELPPSPEAATPDTLPPSPTDTPPVDPVTVPPPDEAPSPTVTMVPSETLTPLPASTETPPPTPTATAIPLDTATPTETATAIPTSTPTPTETVTPISADSLSVLEADPITSLALPGEVVINEVAWSGTAANTAHEWLELFNTTTLTITVTGWVITSSSGVNIPLNGSISPNGYYLIERNDNAVSDVPADLIHAFTLNNAGDTLYLSTSGIIIDTANGNGGSWPAGTNASQISMERQDPLLPDTDDNWANNDSTIAYNGHDFTGNNIKGTPGQLNSVAYPTPPPPVPGSVVINEVAWGGTTAATATDEWLELLNVTTQTITCTGWTITSTGGLSLTLNGAILPNSYYLIERSNNGVITDTMAELTPSFGSGLSNSGDALFLSAGSILIDTANGDGGGWPGGAGSPNYQSMERADSLLADTDTNWASNDTVHRNGLARDGLTALNGTPKQPNSTTFPPVTPTPVAPLLIGEFLYDGLTSSTEGDEFVEVCNPLTPTVSLDGYKIGDEETPGGGESMYRFPLTATLAANACGVIAKNAAQFQARFGYPPDFELIVSGSSYSDDPTVPNLSKYTAWGSGSWTLTNDGDELVLLGPGDQILDSVAYGSGNYTDLGLESDASAPSPYSLQRLWPVDTDSMPHDFVRAAPTPGQLTLIPLPPAVPPQPATLPGGMFAFWGDLHAHTTYSDGAGPPYYALAMARAAGLHFYAITDYDGELTSLEWANTLTQTDQATEAGAFVALRGVEWTLDGVGHINVFNTDILLNSQTGPQFDSLSNFYDWLIANPTVIAQFNHPASQDGGDFNNFAYYPTAAPMMVMQEIGNRAQGYQTYESAWVQSNTVGWRVAPTNNSDSHTAQWGSDSPARTGLLAPALTETDLLAAMRDRRVFATEDSNLALALRLNGAWMGSVLTATGSMPLMVDWVDPDSEPLTLYLYDGNLLLASFSQTAPTGQWTTQVKALPGHFFWVKAVQSDGNAAYTAPVWLAGQAPADPLVINELLPTPRDWDWDGNGISTYEDEWFELFNSADRSIGLGGWQLVDSSGGTYSIPLGVFVPPKGFVTLYHAQTDLSLNNNRDTITLLNPNGQVVDSFVYHHTPGYDESWCRLPDAGAAWSEDCGPSPNAANWEKSPAAPLTVKIYAAKRLTYNAWVRVKGRVTAPPGLLGSRNMYIQDDTAGILIHLPKEFYQTFNLGDKVAVVGHLRIYHEEFEIDVEERSDVDFLEPGLPPPPLPIVTTSMLEPYEGRLVQLQGQVVDFKGRTLIWLNDGTGQAKTYLRSSTGIKKPYLKVGMPVTAIGIVSQYSGNDDPARDDYRLLPRYQTDLLIAASTPASPAHWPAYLPETGY